MATNCEVIYRKHGPLPPADVTILSWNVRPSSRIGVTNWCVRIRRKEFWTEKFSVTPCFHKIETFLQCGSSPRIWMGLCNSKCQNRDIILIGQFKSCKIKCRWELYFLWLSKRILKLWEIGLPSQNLGWCAKRVQQHCSHWGCTLWSVFPGCHTIDEGFGAVA